MRTLNPALRDKSFLTYDPANVNAGKMTIQGTVNKTGILMIILSITAIWIWNHAALNPEGIFPIMMISAIAGLITAIITIFKKKWAGITAPIYAGLEGLVVGSISALVDMQYPGIALQAVLLTACILFSLLAAYKSRLIKPTENFKLGVVAATGGILFIYFFSFIFQMFGLPVGFIHDSGPIGIGFSLVIVVIAALNLVLDFDFIENASEAGAPKYMEWYGAFGLMVTLIWLYLEILRLLTKLQRK
ncbi:Bax inhibitor-1/YccA family protein [Thermoproteota archaeon]